MRILFATGLAAAALVPLSACTKPAPATGAGGAPAASAPASAASGPLALDQLPHRKPGLWRQTITFDGAAAGAPSNELCIDADSEAKMSAFSQHNPGADCSPPQVSRNLDGSLTFVSSCALGPGGKVDTKGVVSGDFNSSITMAMDSTTEGSPVAAMNGAHKMTVTSTWTGPCAAGQKGGDMIMANGMKMNLLERRRPRTPGGPAGG